MARAGSITDLTKRPDGWYGTCDDVGPVGPFSSAPEARSAAMRAWREDPRRPMTRGEELLLSRIRAAYASGGAAACTVPQLISSPQGRHYSQMRRMVAKGELREQPVVIDGRRVVAYVPPERPRASALAELLEAAVRSR